MLMQVIRPIRLAFALLLTFVGVARCDDSETISPADSMTEIRVILRGADGKPVMGAAVRPYAMRTVEIQGHGFWNEKLFGPTKDYFSDAAGVAAIRYPARIPIGPVSVDRKAGEERSFWTVETNFLPGRTFESLEDLNGQAFQWATERMEHRPQGKSRLIPAKAFEHERSYLHALPRHLPPPYQEHQRGTDQYGYVAFGANYYWVPETRRENVKVLQYADSLKIFLRHVCLAEYPLPPDGVREQRFSPPDQPPPRHQPNNIRRRDARQEEQFLRALGPEVAAYLDFALTAPGIQRHRFIRALFAFSRKLPHEILAKTLERALHYRILDLATFTETR